MSAPEKAAATDACKHPIRIMSCGIKVCMDCGEPLNAKAKAVARLKSGIR